MQCGQCLLVDGADGIFERLAVASTIVLHACDIAITMRAAHLTRSDLQSRVERGDFGILLQLRWREAHHMLLWFCIGCAGGASDQDACGG